MWVFFILGLLAWAVAVYCFRQVNKNNDLARQYRQENNHPPAFRTPEGTGFQSADMNEYDLHITPNLYEMRSGHFHLAFLALVPLGFVLGAFGFGVYVGGLGIAFVLGLVCGLSVLMFGCIA